MWWMFFPETSRMCRVIPAAVAKARQNSSASCGSKGGFPSGLVSGGKLDVVDEEGPTREVQGHVDQGLVQGHGHRTEPSDPGLVAQRLGQHLAQGDPHVLHGVVGVDVEVPTGRHGEVEAGVAAQLADHVIEERQTGLHFGDTRPVDVEVDLDRRLLGGPEGGPRPRWRMASGWSWSSQAFVQSGQEPVVLLGETHRHPQATGESWPLRTVSHEHRGIEEVGPHLPRRNGEGAEQNEIGVGGPRLHREVGKRCLDPAPLLVMSATRASISPTWSRANRPASCFAASR